MASTQHRPDGYIGENDSKQEEIFQGLKKLVLDSQRLLNYPALRLPPQTVRVFCAALTEFAEDLHCDIGIWDAYERFNQEFFSNPLPLTPCLEYMDGKNLINKSRIHHFIWIMYSLINPDLVLSPEHKGLFALSTTITEYLHNEFLHLSKNSGIKEFLNSPSDYGWDVKEKLLWLGCHSYFFRFCFHNYIKNRGREDIGTIDDFVCQETTIWSGLGVIDILSSVLDIPEKHKTELRSWYERHLAYYKITNCETDTVYAINLINDKPYTIHTGEFTSQFNPQQVMMGSLVPWNEKWYWSGTQYNLKILADNDINKLKNELLLKSSSIAYRYCDELAEKARNSIREQYQLFTKYHNGENPIIYPDGLSMAADEEKFFKFVMDSKPEEDVKRAIEKHGLKGSKPNMSFPPHVLECEKGIAVYFYEKEGKEIFIYFDYIISGLEKKGNNLDDDEKEVIRSFVLSDSICPEFVNQMINRYGGESLESAFLIPRHSQLNIPYLLRKYKGLFYRKRYPSLSFTN